MYTVNHHHVSTLSEAVRFANLHASRAHVVRPTDKPNTFTHTPVKNLGWLLDNMYGQKAKIVHAAHVFVPYQPSPTNGRDVVFAVLFEDGTAYATMFADRAILRDFLQRPSMQGFTVYWYVDKYGHNHLARHSDR